MIICMTKLKIIKNMSYFLQKEIFSKYDKNIYTDKYSVFTSLKHN